MGEPHQDTRAAFNVGFYILNPTDNRITMSYRKWNETYAKREWAWYISENRSVEKLKAFAPIWDTMHGGDNIVNSNYGWLWNREDQLRHVIDLLRRDPQTRRAVITLYDGKEYRNYIHDTPCTISIQFMIHKGAVHMTVLMRSNDLWYGFCNDQYCFSNLLQWVAINLNLPVGTYYHFSQNLHLYLKHCFKNKV